MALAGSGTFTYETSTEDWGDPPPRMELQRGHGIAVDSRGDIYVAEVSWTDCG